MTCVRVDRFACSAPPDVCGMQSFVYYINVSLRKNREKIFTQMTCTLFTQMTHNLFTQMTYTLFTQMTYILFTQMTCTLFTRSKIIWIAMWMIFKWIVIQKMQHLHGTFDVQYNNACQVYINVLVGWLCFTSHRQLDHLETAPHLLSLAKDVKLRFHTGNRTLRRRVAVHYPMAAPRQLHPDRMFTRDKNYRSISQSR